MMVALSTLLALTGLMLLHRGEEHSLSPVLIGGPIIAIAIAPSPVALAATIAVEGAIALLVLARRWPPAKAMIHTTWVNCLTQPLLFATLPLLPGASGQGYWMALLGAELVVVLVEAALYRGMGLGLGRATGLAVTANAASVAAGLLLPI